MTYSTIKFNRISLIQNLYKNIRLYVDFGFLYKLLDKFDFEFHQNRQYAMNAILINNAKNDN